MKRRETIIIGFSLTMFLLGGCGRSCECGAECPTCGSAIASNVDTSSDASVDVDVSAKSVTPGRTNPDFIVDEESPTDSEDELAVAAEEEVFFNGLTLREVLAEVKPEVVVGQYGSYSFAEICEDFLSQQPLYRERSYSIIDDDWILAKTESDKTVYFAPRAVYGSAWNVSTILRTWYDRTEPWIQGNDRQSYHIWTPDYAHHLAIYDGWLWIDNTRICPVDPTEYSLEPMDLLAAYQSGEWDGSKRWSIDGSTSAEVCEIGSIVYEYIDPPQLAEFGELPDYLWSEHVKRPIIMVDDSECEWKFYPENLFFFPDHNTAPVDRAQLYSKVFVDLPDGKIHDYANKYCAYAPEVGTYIGETGRVTLYYYGAVIDTWNIDGEPKKLFYAEDTAWVFCDDKILKLRPEREPIVVKDGVLNEIYPSIRGDYSFLYLNNELLSIWSTSGFDDIIDMYVINVHGSVSGPTFYETEDGEVYVFEASKIADSVHENAHTLGREKLDFYVDAYEKLYAEHRNTHFKAYAALLEQYSKESD